MRLLFVFAICAIALPLLSQKHDNVWLMGQNSQTTIEHAGTIIDFNTNPPDIYYEFRDMYFRQVNASICDTAGNLLFYTNGIYIANALGEPMENGEGLNPGPHATSNQNYGYILDQGALILPVPENSNLFYLLHMDKELNESVPTFYSSHLYFSLIDMSEENGLGAVLQKNQVILNNNLDKGKLTATRHANGRDWWLLARNYGTNQYYRISLHRTDIELLNIQQVGNPIPSNSVGQAVFSPDGTKYATVNVAGYVGDPIYLSIYDFDRCTGLLSNPVQFTYVDSASCGGVAISPNNRFLYVSSFRYLYQYDLWAPNIEASRITIAEWDGFVENNFFATTFYLAQLAPDGKIYINSNNSVSYLHVINQPDLPGLLCDVCQHCVDLPTKNAFSMPNFPNYRLGPLEGSPCDTLRQPPTAAWGYVSDGLTVQFTDSSYHDIRTWHWDFGDGASDTLSYPSHTYPAEGMYHVCLAVQNPRGADTLCRWVSIMNTAVSTLGEGMQLSLSPNPATDQITLRIENLPAGPLAFLVYDALGRAVLHQSLLVNAYRVEQSLDISNLAAGVYFWRVATGDGSTMEGKFFVGK